MALFSLEGKVVLVTGGNSGIGLAMAEATAEAGADVCIWGRDEIRNEAAKEKISAHGHEVMALSCDVTNEKVVETSFQKTLEKFGRVDACFANAGKGGIKTRFHEMTLQEWQLIFRCNMEGVMLTFRAAIRHMLDRGGGGSLVVTSSLAGRFGLPMAEHYAATKAGVNALVRSLAVEYARYGIRANAILPGFIETRMTQDMLSKDIVKAKILPRIPMRRWGRASDFKGLAVYLAADCSAYHTGDSLVVDGGYSCF